MHQMNYMDDQLHQFQLLDFISYESKLSLEEI
jgi:hypothetical protein